MEGSQTESCLLEDDKPSPDSKSSDPFNQFDNGPEKARSLTLSDFSSIRHLMDLLDNDRELRNESVNKGTPGDGNDIISLEERLEREVEERMLQKAGEEIMKSSERGNWAECATDNVSTTLEFKTRSRLSLSEGLSEILYQKAYEFFTELDRLQNCTFGIGLDVLPREMDPIDQSRLLLFSGSSLESLS